MGLDSMRQCLSYKFTYLQNLIFTLVTEIPMAAGVGAIDLSGGAADAGSLFVTK